MIELPEADAPDPRERRRTAYAGFTAAFVLVAILMVVFTVCGGLLLALWYSANIGRG